MCQLIAYKIRVVKFIRSNKFARRAKNCFWGTVESVNIISIFFVHSPFQPCWNSEAKAAHLCTWGTELFEEGLNGVANRRKTAKNLVDSGKNWNFWPLAVNRERKVNHKRNCSLDLSILRTVLNSLMTGCVSYFKATLTPYAHWPSGFSVSPGVLLDQSLGLRIKGRVESSLFLDLQFRHPVYILVNRGQYWKLLLVFFQRVKKGQSKDPPQGKTLGVSDTFNIQEKRFLLSWP